MPLLTPTGAEQPAEPMATSGLDAVARRPCDRTVLVLAGILGAALALRLAWVLLVGHEPSRISDASTYLHYGRGIAAGKGYSVYSRLGGILPDTPTAYHPIGYPAMLGGLFWVAALADLDQSATLAGLANVVLGTATAAFVYGIARPLFDRTTALVAAGLVAVWPNLVFYAGSALSETLFAFLIVSAVWIAVARPWPDHLTRTRALAFGAVVGISVLVRPFSALLLPALLAVALISRLDRRRALRFVGWATLAAAVLIAPWTIRNAVQMHAFIPVTTNIGGLLCIDNSPGATGTLRATLPYCTRGIEVDDPSRREVVTNRVDTERALRWIRAHPIGELRLLPLRLYYSYAGDSDGLRQAQIQNPADPPVATRDAGILATVASAYFFVASAFALVGSAWFLRRTAPRRLYVAIAAFALLATPLYTYGLARFHVPALPLAAVLAAPSLVALVRAARNGHRDPDPSDDARSATAEAGAHARTGAA